MTKEELLKKFYPSKTEEEIQNLINIVTIKFLDVEASVQYPIDWATQFITQDSLMIYEPSENKIYIITNGEITNPNVQILG